MGQVCLRDFALELLKKVDSYVLISLSAILQPLGEKSVICTLLVIQTAVLVLMVMMSTLRDGYVLLV